MRSKITLILLALNLAVFGYLFLVQRHATASRVLEENRRRVLGPEAANLDRLQISFTPAEGEGPATSATEPATSLTLERETDRWILVTPAGAAPAKWPANDFAVRRMLNGLQFLEHETSFPVSDLTRNGQSLADYGLDQPRLTLTLTPAASAAPSVSPSIAASKEGASAKEVQPAKSAAPIPPLILKIGGDTAVGNRLYVLSPDATRIHVVNRSIYDNFTLGESALRSAQLFTIPAFEARALTLQTSTTGPRTRLRRDQDNWAFESPVTTRATKTRTELALNSLHALQVTRFAQADHRPDPALTGLATPSLRITLEGNGRRETLSLGLPLDPEAASVPGVAAVEYYARLDERSVLFTTTLSTRLVADLRDAATALRDRRVLPFDPARVTALTLADAPAREQNRPLRIQKLDSTETAWRLLPADADPTSTLRADPATVEQLLQRLALLDAVRFANDAPTAIELENLGFNRPERTVTLQLAAPEKTAANTAVSAPTSLTLEFALPGGADPAIYARVAGQPYVYALAPDALDSIPVAPRVYRDRQLSRLPDATRIARLVIKPAAPDDAKALLDLALPADRPLAEVLASETPARRDALTALLKSLRSLRAQSIVREDFPAATLVDGVEKPWAYVLEATLDPAGPPVTLYLAERTGASTQLAGSPSLGLVFTLDQPVLDALWTLAAPAAPSKALAAEGPVPAPAP